MTENKPTKVIMTKQSNYVMVKLIGDLNDAEAENYINEILPKVLEANFDLIVNCDLLTKLSPSWIRAFVLTEQGIRKIKKSVRLILVTDAIKDLFNDRGLARTLIITNNLRDAVLSLGLVNKKSLDVGFVNPFLEATLNVLKIQFQSEARAGKIYIKKDVSEMSGDISGVIGLISSSFSGNVIITFPEKTFLSIMSKMHGEDYSEISKENADGASELSNMIFGQAKVILNEQGYGIKTALPSVIIGKNHRFSANKQELIVVVPFESDMGGFFVELCLLDN